MHYQRCSGTTPWCSLMPGKFQVPQSDLFCLTDRCKARITVCLLSVPHTKPRPQNSAEGASLPLLFHWYQMQIAPKGWEGKAEPQRFAGPSGAERLPLDRIPLQCAHLQCLGAAPRLSCCGREGGREGGTVPKPESFKFLQFQVFLTPPLVCSIITRLQKDQQACLPLHSNDWI